MILTVTVNAALDRAVAVPSVRPGRRHRATESRSAAGGKGVNIARALRLLGAPVVATGLLGGPTGARIRELLDADQVIHDFVEVAGDSRTNMAILDPTTGEQTEINERGPEVSAAELERFIERLRYLAGGAGFCVIAGSVPPGVPPEIYATIVSELHALGLPVLVDTDREPLRAALRGQPSVVAPNVAEAEEVVGHEFNDDDDVWTGIGELIEMGAREAIITREAGVVAEICDDHGSRRRCEVSFEPIEAVATVGSGDAFVAGYIAARYRGERAEDCLAYGVACGAESTRHMGAGIVDPAGVDRFRERVTIVERSAGAGFAGARAQS